MKLKFSAYGEEVIKNISAMPEVSSNEQDFDKPFEEIRKLDRKLQAEQIKGKHWAKIRRELSFFFSFQHAAEKRTEDKALRYTETIKCFKAMKNGNALKSIPFIRTAMSYGVLNLSDFEIEQLIKCNKS